MTFNQWSSKLAQHRVWPAVLVVGFSSAAMYGLPTTLLAMLLLAFVCFTVGQAAGLWLVLWSLCPLIAELVASLGHDIQWQMFMPAATWVCVSVYRWNNHWMSVVLAQVLVGLAVTFTLLALFPHYPDQAQAKILQLLNALQQQKALGFASFTSQQLVDAAHVYASCWLGVLSVVHCVLLLAMSYLGRFWHCLISGGGAQIQAEWHQLRLPSVGLLLLILVALSCYMVWPSALPQILAVVAYPMMLSGFSIIICWVRRFHRISKTLFVFAVIVLPGIAAIILTMIGFLDCCIHFRQFTERRKP